MKILLVIFTFVLAVSFNVNASADDVKKVAKENCCEMQDGKDKTTQTKKSDKMKKEDCKDESAGCCSKMDKKSDTEKKEDPKK